jgi:carboxymethylenebutenolidase
MKRQLFFCALVALALSTGASSPNPLHARATHSVLPSPATAQTILNTTTRHREWVNVADGSSPVLAFVVYPERADTAPVVLVRVKNETSSVRARAVADQLAAEGFIGVVPDVLTGLGPNHSDGDGFAGPDDVAQALDHLGMNEVTQRYDAARTYAERLPAANGTSVWLNLDPREARADISDAGDRAVASVGATAANWPGVVEHLSRVTHNHPTFVAAAVRLKADTTTIASVDPHAMHMAHSMAPAAQNQRTGSTASRTIPGLADKARNLPASYYTATATLARSPLKKEWVDIPMGDVKLHAWVEYPEGNGKAGVVIVMQHGVGLDDWMRSVADQLAADGFIAVAPDAWSGTGPNGGNRDSFQFDDEAMRAAARITPDETQRRYKAARDWALELPRANGKTGSIGFCAGGGNSFRFAAEVPELNAAVVFYGGPPAEELAKKINAPVLGFYGENDARVTAAVAPTTEMMKRLGKSYEPHIYPKVTHSFVYFQDLSVNRDAVADAWPRTIAFYNKYLK